MDNQSFVGVQALDSKGDRRSHHQSHDTNRMGSTTMGPFVGPFLEPTVRRKAPVGETGGPF